MKIYIYLYHMIKKIYIYIIKIARELLFLFSSYDKN